MKRFIFSSLLMLLTGCATYNGPNVVQTENGQTYRATSLQQANSRVGEYQTVSFRVGFMQGCDSGHASEGNALYRNTKDEIRYGEDMEYRRGWDEGYLQCKNDYIYPSRYYDAYAYGYYPYYYGPRYYFGFGHGFGPRWGPYYRGGFYYGRPFPYRRWRY